jgi:hypothetical protein
LPHRLFLEHFFTLTFTRSGLSLFLADSAPFSEEWRLGIRIWVEGVLFPAGASLLLGILRRQGKGFHQLSLYTHMPGCTHFTSILFLYRSRYRVGDPAGVRGRA